MIAVDRNGGRKQLLRQLIRVANAEIKSLSRNRMQRLRRIAEQDSTLADHASREFKCERERAPIGDTDPRPGAWPETSRERLQERLFRKFDQRAGIFRSCRPHQAVMVAFGQ